MKPFLVVLLFFGFAVTMQDITEVRKSYATASTSKANAQKFHELVREYSSNNPTLIAYKAAAIMLMSKHELDVIQKKKKFTQGAHLLESAVEKEKYNAEIRLIRLSIQENVPKIVKYSMNIAEDKDFLMKNYKQQTQSVKVIIKQYVKQSDAFSDEEKNSFN